MAKKQSKRGVTNEKIFGLLLDMDERMATKDDLKKLKEDIEERMATKADLRGYATKNDIERMKDEILEPLIKAVDKDAKTIVTHGKRLLVLEHKAGMAAK